MTHPAPGAGNPAPTAGSLAPAEKDTAWYEREYNARASIPDHEKIFRDWAFRAREARFSLPGRWSLTYGESRSETVDIIPGDSGKPLLVFIHGGYWRSLDKSDFTWVAQPYVQHGYSVALLNYGLAPHVTLEDIVRQTLRGVEWLYRNADKWGFGRDKIIVTGHSAGAHLAAMCAVARWPVWAPDLPVDLIKGMVGVSGLYELHPLIQAPFIQKDLKLNLKRSDRLSPANMRPSHTDMPVLLAAGALESSEFRRHTQLLGHKWKNWVRMCEDVPHENHLTVCESLGDDRYELTRATLLLLKTLAHR